jgi:hypothetical protein
LQDLAIFSALRRDFIAWLSKSIFLRLNDAKMFENCKTMRKWPKNVRKLRNNAKMAEKMFENNKTMRKWPKIVIITSTPEQIDFREKRSMKSFQRLKVRLCRQGQL